MSLDRRLRGLSRLGSPMMRRAIGRTLNEALAGLETAATGAEGSELTAGMKWWGWGDPDRRLDLPPAAVAALREELGVARRRRRRARPARAGLATRAAARPRRRPLRGRRGPRRPRGSLAPCGGPQLPGPGPAAHRAPRARPRRRPAPAGRRRRSRRCWVPARRPGVAVVPYGGGTSVVGGLDAVADGHAAVVSLDLAHLRSVELDPRSLTASLGPGLSGPGRRARRSAPSEPRWATSRSPSSRRPSAASPPPARPGRPRAATAASTRLSPRSSSPLPAAGFEPARSRTPPPARRCASWSSARRGPSA